MCSDESMRMRCIYFYFSKVKAGLMSGSQAPFSESGPCLPTVFPGRQHLDGILITSSLFLIYRKLMCASDEKLFLNKWVIAGLSGSHRIPHQPEPTYTLGCTIYTFL